MSVESVQVGAGAAHLWDESRAAFKRRDYHRAADLMQALLDRWGEASDPPGAAALRLNLGVALLRLGETRAGVAHLRRAVELDPGAARPWQKLGAGLGRLGEDVEALACFERAAALAPDVAEYQWRLGEQYKRLGQRDLARAALVRCLQMQPGHPGAAEALADLERARRPGWRRWLFG